MKPLQGDSVNVNSRSCTCCDSRSESDRQTLKRLLVQGSKINKLLTGKYYVHLRESDLLDKLNKTRALYDTLRSQLFSSNESSTADLKPRQSSIEIRKAFVEAKKSSDIFALVDLVHKGAVLGSRKLSECCSCCTCSSKFRLHENVQKARRNRLAYGVGNIASRSSFISKQETGEAKNIKSDPCTCTCFKKEQIKKNRALLEKVCPAKSIVKRDRLFTPSNDLKLMSINNCKLRKSYHKLKRAKAYPSPYMENIGEGGRKIVKKSKLTSNTVKKKGSIELLKTTKTVKHSNDDRKVLQKKEPEASSTIKNTAEGNMSRPNKTAIKLKDKVGGNRQVQSSELKKKLSYRSRKINLPLEENAHIRDTSSTSSTSILKEISFKTGHERLKCHLRSKQRNKKRILAESNTKITEQPILNEKLNPLKRTNEVQHSRECKIPSQKDADDAKKIEKMLPYSFTPGKELINSNIATVSISSVKKRYPTCHKKSSSNSFNKINKSNLKTRSSVLFRKRLLSAPLYFRPRPLISEEPRHLEEPFRHKIPLHSEKPCPCENCHLQEALRLSEDPGRRKKPSKVKHKKIKSGSHGLKRCLCNIKFKISETKLRNSKNVTNESLVDDNQRIPSKSLLSSVKSFAKASNDDPEHMSDHAIKCEGSDYVTQTQAITKNKQATQNETNAHFEIKYNNADSNESIKHCPAKDIFYKTKLSIHALISDCVCKEVEQFMYKHYGKPNINVGGKWRRIQDEQAVIDSSNCIVPKCECLDENIVSDEIGKSKDRGKSNTRLRIKSILKDASITTEKPWKLQNQAVQTVVNSTTQKKHKQKREKSLKQLEKKSIYASNPRFSIELLNTGYPNEGLKINYSKVKCVYKCGEGTEQLPTKQSQTSTTTTTKYDSATTKNIHSILISQNSEMLTPILKRIKTKLPDMSTHRVRPYFSRKFFNNKRTSCLYCPIDKDNKIKQDSKIIKNDMENLQKVMLVGNTITGKEQSLLLDLANKRCLRTSKLRKKGRYYKKSSVNADTKSDNIKPGFQDDAKVTKYKYSNQLSKCKCDPDEYSEKNKSNEQFRILMEQTKIKAESSDKQFRTTSQLLFVKSDFQQRNPTLQKFKKMRINSEPSHQPQYAKDINLANFFKQNVRMASNFSFNIEFYKRITSENNYYQKRTKNILTKRYSSSRQLDNKKVNPINRCFCTLEISKMDEQRRDSKLLSPFRTKNLTQVYAMSTVTIAENKIKTPEILKVDHNFHCIDSYHSTCYSKNVSSHIKHWQYFNKNPTCGFSISMIAFKAKNIQSYIRDSKYKLLQIRSREQSLLDFDSNEAIRFESAFSFEVDYLKNICSKKQPIVRNVQSQNNSIAISQHNPLTNQPQLTGVQPLLRRRYCTMNIQVARQKRKLLDYECEPGICIPGECDPYECQKLIMKRLMRKVSRMSGTDSRSKSSGNETSSTESRSRRLQSSLDRQPKYRTRGHHARSRPSPPQGLKYQTLPRSTLAPARAHRQAVKVGSTFSFDIEFSKSNAKSAPPPLATDVVKLSTRHVSSKSSTTYRSRGMDRGTRHSGGRHHRETQSMMKQMRHRASNVTPMLKRCFCTLKLQKKGRQQKELELRTIHQGTSTPPKFDVESPVLRTSERGQNTKRRRKFQELLPYECEPGICIPGECDPYECLELIKKRNKHTKDFGTDSMASSTSSSTMTSGQKRKMKRIQARNIRPKQVRSSYTSVRSKPSVMTLDTISKPGQDRQEDRQVAKPSRQAVKISSNFSFNIEFYKDQTGGSIVSDRRPSEVFVHKAPKEVRRVPKKVYAQRRMREGSSQSGTSSRDDDSQIGIFQRGQSTMTSGYVKRCFCTAELQGYNIDAGTAARRPPSKLKRCFCTLKLLSKKNRIKDGGVGHERATSVAMTQTRGRGPPFECVSECEAAVRTQTKERNDLGNCDPYECIKLTRKRLAKEKMIGTDGPRTRSTSSYFSSSNPSRGRMTQYRSAWPKTRMTQARRRGRGRRGRRQDSLVPSSESVVQEKIMRPVSPQRQAVRIGSNFSFNIEFYKDKGPNNLEVQMAAPVVKRYRRPVSMRDRGHGAYRRTRTRDRGFRGRRLPTLSRDTQMESIQSRDVGLGPILRRCFCTLQLKKKSKAKAKTKAVAKAVSKPVSKTGSKAVSKPGSKTGSKAENKAETSTETKAEVKAETKTALKETDSQKQKKTNLKCLCDQINKKNECTCTPPIKEVATLHDKSITTSKKPKESIVAAKKTKETIVTAKKTKENVLTAKKTKIMKRRKAFPYKLEPYECEPGICVPGECDPYECLKLINKRLMYSSGTSTDRRGTRSSSNMAVCTNRDCAAQSYIQHKKKMRTRDTYTRHRSPWPRTKMTQPRTTRRRGRGRRRNYALSESVLQERVITPASPQRQAVRIGSNFSFNIEFYKDKSPNNLEVQVSAPVVKSYRRPVSIRDRGHGGYRRTRTRDRGLRVRQFSSLSRDSQMESIQSRDVGLGPILRRCFCTLKLQKKSKAKGKTKAIAKAMSKAESKKAVSKAESKTGSKTGSKAENKAETSTETKAEVKAETKTVQKETDSQKQKKTNLKCLCDQINKKNECTCTPPIKEVATLHDKSITTSKKPKESIVAAKKTKETIVTAKKTKENVLTAKKTKIMKRRKAFPYKLEPYECEPGICVPGECDPYECLKLINKRLVYSSGTSTDPRGTRSTSNMAVCTNRDCEAQSYIQLKKQMRTKNTYTRYREKRPYRDRRPHERRPHERRSYERRPHERRLRERRPHRERKPESRSSGFRSTDVDKPTRQAVKIGSNFNFDIEFSKNKANGGAAVVTSKPIKQYRAYDKPRRTSSRSTEGPSTYYRNKKAQHYKANRDIDSQALGPSMRSTMTGTVAPFLKRCFCTLQLNCRTENQGTPFDCLVDITKTGKLKSQVKSQVKPEAIQFTVCADKNKHYRKQAQFHNRKPYQKLLPYECEPGFCVPGECDPYECMKRIKKRMQSKQVGTIYRSRSFSSSTGEGKKYRPRKMQTRSSTPRRRNVKTYRRYDEFEDDSRSRSISGSSDKRRKYRPRMKTRSYTPSRRKVKAIGYNDQFQDDTISYRQAEVVCDTKPKRQTVRIGSNFNFDIEFFKDNSQPPCGPCGPQVNSITKKDGKKRWSSKRGRAKRLMNTRISSSDEKNYMRRRGVKRETMTRTISTKSMSSYGKKYNPRDIQSQSEYKKTYSRGIGTPKLKRCFCTLKLEKRGKRRQFNTRKIEPIFKTSSKKMEPSFKCVSKKMEPSFKCASNKLEPTTKCVSTHTKSKTKAIIEPVGTGTKPKTCECDKGRKGHKCKCNLNTCECKKRKKNKNCKCYERCECVEEEPPPKKPSSIFTCKPFTAKEFPCKKGKECKCCKCNTYFMKTNEYRCKKGDACKCPICNTPALESNEFPCKKGKSCKCCKCNTYSVKTSKYRCKKGEICKCPVCNTPALELNQNIINMNQNQNKSPIKEDRNLSPVNQDKCKCNTSKSKCKCNTKKRNKCLCEKVSQNIIPVKQDQNVISVKQDKFPCKKGKECKCCRCNPPGLEPNKFPCKKGKECKCCRCNPPGLEPNEFPCKKGKECKCCRCNPPGLEPNEFPCKKGKKCKCCKCYTPGLEPNEFPCKKGKECKCCRCSPPGLEANGYPCKKGIKCKCCKCNTLLKQNQNNIPTNQDNFPCKKGKECKCCTCSTYSMKTNKYRCKKGEICKCPICNTPTLEPNENKLPKKQDQNIIPVNQDMCKCNKSKNKCKCNTQKQGDKGKKTKKNKNCKCFKSCECVAEAPAPPAKKPSTLFTCKPSKPFTCKPSKPFTCKPSKPFTCKPSKPFTCKPSKPFTCKPSTQFTCKTYDKKTSTKKNYDPLKQIDLRDDCGVCDSPYECLKRGIRRMYQPYGKRMKRRPRMSVSSIAATIVPGYTHKRTKYKGEPYSPDQIETVVEQPRYPFLHGKDARQGVKITSNFSFDIEFFKEMLPPLMNNVKEMDEDSYQKGRAKKRIKENYRAGDARSVRYGARNDFKYSDDSDSEPDRKSSPFEMLRRCFCTTKLQKSNFTQHLTVGRVQEIRPMAYFGPKEYLVQYQIQQPTRKYFKTNSQELKTIMSYTPNKYNKVYNNKRCYCHKCFNRSNPTIQGAQCIPKHSEIKQTTFKKMLNICKNLFTKRSNKINTNKPESWTELKKEANNQQPLIDVLKASKSERHPKKVVTAEIKKTKSLKVAKLSDVVYKKKYSRFQSGDHYKTQNTGIKFVKRNCKQCQNKLRQTIPVHDKVRFTTLRTAKAFHSKLNDPIVKGQKKDPKSVSYLFKSPKFKNCENLQYLKVCSCCGGIKRIKNPLASNCLGIKNKILECDEDTTVIPKDLVGITKTDKPEEETTLSQENKVKNNRDCRCCICKSNSKQKAIQDKSGDLSVSGNVICKKEAERSAENMNHIECIENKSDKCICGTTIGAAKSEIKVHALGSGYKPVPDKKERNKETKQEAHICEILHKAECKEVIDKTIKEKYKLKKLAKLKAPCTQVVTESVLDNQDSLSNTAGIFDSKSTYRKCQSYLRDHMHTWKRFQKAAFTGYGVETLRRLKLSCETRKYVKGGTGKLENHPVTDATIRFNNTDRKKGLQAKKPVWRRHSGSVFGWSPFMLSLRKRPWLSAYYKWAGVFPHCLTILQVWRQFMDIMLFMLAAAALSPCLLGLELCKALKSCFLCTA